MVVHMSVIALMIVFVSVDIFYVSVLVFMGLVAICTPQAPDKIHEPERNEQPGSQIAAKAFHDLKLVERNSK